MTSKKSLKIQLAGMNFLEFAIWGSYLTCIGNYLGTHGLGSQISLFYAIQGVVSIFMPAIMGMLADKYIQPQRLLGLCQLLAAVFMGAAWLYGSTHEQLHFGTFFTLYTLSVAFFMPTIALANTVAFSILKRNGMDTVNDFPPIRVLGTVGFIAAMWFVNGFYIHEGHWGYMLANPLGDTSPYDPRFQFTVNQLALSAILGVILAVYCFMLPKCPVVKRSAAQGKKTVVEMLGFDAFKLFKTRRMAVFFIFSMLLGVSLQITNGFATPFITSFKAYPEYLDTFAANNATLLTSLSQISEACCILLIPLCLRRFGIKNVMLIAMGAWVLRFGFFGIGTPAMPGVILFIVSMVVYGVAFDFFNVSGALYVEKETDPGMQASAQGLFMLMTNGIGATVGMLVAGAIVNHFCQYEGEYMVGNWHATWLIFAAYALVVGVLFFFVFPSTKRPKVSLPEAIDAEGGGDGFVNAPVTETVAETPATSK